MVGTIYNPHMHRFSSMQSAREKDNAFSSSVHIPLSKFVTTVTTAHLGPGVPSLPFPTTESLTFVKAYSFLKGFSFFYS